MSTGALVGALRVVTYLRARSVLQALVHVHTQAVLRRVHSVTGEALARVADLEVTADMAAFLWPGVAFVFICNGGSCRLTYHKEHNRAVSHKKS